MGYRGMSVAIGIGLVASSIAAQAQSARPARVGFLACGAQVSFPLTVDPFMRGMRELGYVTGSHVSYEIRTAEGRAERHPRLVSELLKLQIDIIVVSCESAARAAKEATRTLPIVLGSSSDPVASGLVPSLARPGGNITGLSSIATDLSIKRLEMLKAVLPGLKKIAVLLNPDNPTYALELQSAQAAAKSVDVETTAVNARDPGEIERGFAAMAGQRAQALLVATEPFLYQQRRQVVELALKHGLPSIYPQRGYVEAGGLMSYGQDLSESFRRAATYVDKILKGAKPGSLPIEQPTAIELVINRKTANALGVGIPTSLMMRADQVLD